MVPIWLAEFSFMMLVALVGIVAGWWLRGRPAPRAARPTTAVDRKQVAQQALESLHAAAETVRTCVQQHIECMQTIRAELHESSATEPAIITNAAASIIAANGLVQHQFNNIQQVIDSNKDAITSCLDSSEGLLFTFAALDRQKHVYRQVLSSLEMLAAELASDVDGHGRRLQHITQGLSDDRQPTAAGVRGAVTQILDATDDLERKVASAERRLEQEADTVHMQAILSHTDLLTSLPNRRAFEAELDLAAASPGRTAPATVVMLDIDAFSGVNGQYGHQGGDVILRQAAGIIKELLRGKDLVARYGGDTFALLLQQTTTHDALPVAERVRKRMEEAKFSHGNAPLHVTASLGIAQVRPDETPAKAVERAGEALRAARQAGGNMCFWHDGTACHPVSSAFHVVEQQPAESMTLASLWRESINNAEPNAPVETPKPGADTPVLSGRSLFASNLSRRLAEWKRGGAAVSVVVLRVDQMTELVARFGPQADGFLRPVIARLLEAATRDMDERCEFEDGTFAILLPATDEANAAAVADRLRSQVRQCKIRMGNDLWDLTASIGLSHCSIASRVMDLMLSAEAAMHQASKCGGDTVHLGQPVQQESQ